MQKGGGLPVEDFIVYFALMSSTLINHNVLSLLCVCVFISTFFVCFTMIVHFYYAQQRGKGVLSLFLRQKADRSAPKHRRQLTT